MLHGGEALGGITSVAPQVRSSDPTDPGTERPGAVQIGNGSATGSSRAGPRRHAGRLGSSIRRRQSKVFGPTAFPVSATRAESGARKRRRTLGSTSASVGDERGVRRRRWPLRWTSGGALRRSTERAVTTKVIERQRGASSEVRELRLSWCSHQQATRLAGGLGAASLRGGWSLGRCRLGDVRSAIPAPVHPCGLVRVALREEVMSGNFGCSLS